MIKLRSNVRDYLREELELIKFRIADPNADEDEFLNRLDVLWWKLDNDDLKEMRTVVEGRAGWKANVEWYEAFDLS